MEKQKSTFSVYSLEIAQELGGLRWVSIQINYIIVEWHSLQMDSIHFAADANISY